MIKQGIYLNSELSADDYHSDKSILSRSALMDFKKSPRTYWANHLNPNRPIKNITPAMHFGSAFHTLILEPHLFEEQYFVLPEKVLLKEVGKEKYHAFKKIEKEASQTEKHVLSQADYQKLLSMRESLLAHSRAIGLLEGGVCESSYVWQDEHTGLMLKSRPDILHPNIYVDLKTIDDASPHSFQNSMVKRGYHIQAAMVDDGVYTLSGNKLAAFINICVEKTYPHPVAIYIIDEAAIDYGRCEYKQILLDLKAAMCENVYNDYAVETIGLPTWYMK